MLLTKLENPLFLRPGPGGLLKRISPENRFGLIVPLPLSDLGGVISVMPYLPVPKVCELRNWWKRMSGLVWVWLRGGACGRLESILVELSEFRRPLVSKGAPIRSSFGVGSGSCEVTRLPNSEGPTTGDGTELWSMDDVELLFITFDCVRW